MLLKVKTEAPAPAPIGIAQAFTGSPFVYTPAMPAPPRTILPQPTAPPAAQPPAKCKRGVQAGIARMADAARVRREVCEDAMTLDELLAEENDKITGERTWAARDVAARALAVELDEV